MHCFRNNTENIPHPEQFTFPFYYSPHPLCVLAAQEVQDYLQSRTDWHDELQKGKMFGVLIVRNETNEIGYLAAFSGNLAGSNHHSFFVPPVYDLLNPDGYFKEEEERISQINRRLKDIETNSFSTKEFPIRLKKLKEEAETTISKHKAFMKQSQQERNELRQQNNLSD